MADAALRVLIIDDDQDDFVLTRGLLAEIPTRRYSVDWARTYDEGAAAVRADTHDVYLVDYRLGAHTGVELLADGRRCQGPVILVTGAGDRRDDEAAMRAGAADYIEKSRLDPWLLERAIRYALERKRAERESLASEERLRNVLDQSHDLVFTAAADGTIQFVNKTWREALDYAPADVAGVRIGDVVAAEFRDAFDRAVAEALAGNHPAGVPVDAVFVGHDRRRLVLTGRVTCRTMHGADRELQGWFRNVTDQRRAEDAQRRLAATLEATSDFVGISDANGYCVYLNPAGRRMAGIDEREDITTRRVESVFPARERERQLTEVLPHASREGTWRGESVLEGVDGCEIPVSQVVIAHPSAQGGVWFISTIMRDISDWKRLDRLKSEFVSTVSHELRTPLTSIRGSLGLLEGGVAGALSTQAQGLVRIACGNTDRLIRLINEMLDLDKIEAGKLELRTAALIPAELVRTAVDGIRGLADEYDVRIEEQVEAHRTFEGDRDRVLQVLTNLLSNAVKFCPARSVVRVRAIPVEPTNGALAERVRLGRAPVRFVVENPGPGIAPRDLDRLFARFQQLDGSDRRQRGGTGLGLAISKAIVEQHGGRIGVTSDPGVLTTFWFELPAVAAKQVSTEG